MEKISNTVTYSDYNNFKCCTDCIDKCCRPTTWKILIDEKTMERYRALDGEIAKVIEEGIDKIDGKYFFKSQENQNCSMYDKDGLCIIHKYLGEEYLCDTCKIYPRSVFDYNGLLHYGYHNSCPEVVKLFLMNKNPIDFAIVPRMISFKSGNSERSSFISEPMCFKIRGCCSDILQNKSIPLLERIFYIGELLYRLEASYDKLQNEDEFFNILGFYENQQYIYRNIDAVLYSKLFDYDLKKVLYHSLLRIIKNLVGFENALDVNKEFYSHVNTFYMEFEFFKSADIGELKRRIFDPYLEEHEHVFENYLVSEIFMSRFPYNSRTLKESYIKIIFNYLIVQLFLIGIFHTKDALCDEDIVNAIYYYARKTNHSTGYNESMKMIREQLLNLNMSTITLINLIV